MTVRWTTTFVAASVSAAGCGAAPPVTDVTRVDSAGTVLTISDGPDVPLSFRVIEADTLGGEPEGPESFYQLYPRYVSFGSDGRVAVLDQQSASVTIFNRRGAHELSVGREGEGPGEFRYPSSVALMPSGEVLVFDFQKRALVRFDQDGDPLEGQSLTVPFTGVDMVAGPDGLLLISESRPRSGGTSVRRLLHLGAADTTQLGRSVETQTSPIEYTTCGVRMTQAPLFAAPLVWGTNGRRTAIVAGPDYSVHIFDVTTNTMILRRSLVPEPITMDVVRRELGEGERWSIGGRDCVVPPAEVVEQRGHAADLPLIEEVSVAPDGSVWVQRRVVGQSASVLDVFDPDGSYRGTLREGAPLPFAFLPDGRLAAIETDEYEVDRLVIYDFDVDEAGSDP